MKERDIVYILRNDWKTDAAELRLSLRSVAEHFPHQRVLFYGGRPKGFLPDGGLEFKQIYPTRWGRVRETIRAVCNSSDVSSEFWLFNDDFFILQDIVDDFAFDRGQLRKHINQLYRRIGYNSAYAKMLIATETTLKAAGLPTVDYTMHLPMLIDKQQALAVLQHFRGVDVGFRSLYGNAVGIESTTIADVKINGLAEVPADDWAFCSTSDTSFTVGDVGRWLADKFTTPSRWEAVE